MRQRTRNGRKEGRKEERKERKNGTRKKSFPFFHHENNYLTMLTISIKNNSVSISETERKIILLL